MIKKLKRRFVLNMMFILIFVFGLMTVAFHLYYNYQNRQEDLSLISWVADTGSIADDDIHKYFQRMELDEDSDNEDNSDSRIVAMKFDTKGTFLSFESTTPISETEKEQCIQTGQNIIHKKYVFKKNFLYKLVKKEYGYYIVMKDTRGSGLILQYSEYILAGGIFLIVLCFLFLVSLLLSRFVTKPAEESLNKQKQFVSDASHELKTPLSAIMLNAEALRPSNSNNQNLDNILSEAARMQKLINNLLELARADDASSKLIATEFNLSDAVLQMTLPFESEAYESGIQYITDVEDNLIYCGNSDDIKQVVSILIDNAFKHTNLGGTIRVSLDHSGSTNRISIFNTGDGITTADLPHIFERFYSCDSSRNGKRKSYGLGLAIAKAIVEKHHGTITVTSEYGKNALFQVLLPVNKQHKHS